MSIQFVKCVPEVCPYLPPLPLQLQLLPRQLTEPYQVQVTRLVWEPLHWTLETRIQQQLGPSLLVNYCLNYWCQTKEAGHLAPGLLLRPPSPGLLNWTCQWPPDCEDVGSWIWSGG